MQSRTLHFIFLLLYSTTLFAIPCTSHVKFVVNVLNMRQAGDISQGDVDALASLPVATYEQMREVEDDLHFIASGATHSVSRIGATASPNPFSQHQGDVVRLLMFEALEDVQDSEKNHRLYARSMALGNASGKVMNRLRPGTTPKVKRLLIDRDGKLIGNVMEYVDERSYSKPSEIGVRDQERLYAQLLGFLNRLWAETLPNSGKYNHPAHGDLHPGNIMVRWNADTAQWDFVLIDVGAIPNFRLNNTDEFQFGPEFDRELIYYRLLCLEYFNRHSGDGRQWAPWRGGMNLEALLKDVGEYATWVASVPNGTLVNFQSYDFNPLTQTSIFGKYLDAPASQPTPLDRLVSTNPTEATRQMRVLRRAVSEAQGFVPANRPETKKVLEAITDILVQFDPANAASVAKTKEALERLSLFAKLEGEVLIIHFAPR